MKTWHDLPLLLTLGEAAELLRVSERTTRRMIQDGRLEASKPAKGYLIPRENVAAVAGATIEDCEEYRDALNQLLIAIDAVCERRGEHWYDVPAAREAVENAHSLLDAGR